MRAIIQEDRENVKRFFPALFPCPRTPRTDAEKTAENTTGYFHLMGKMAYSFVNDIDASVRREEEYARRLTQAQSRAKIDALTCAGGDGSI